MKLLHKILLLVAFISMFEYKARSQTLLTLTYDICKTLADDNGQYPNFHWSNGGFSWPVMYSMGKTNTRVLLRIQLPPHIWNMCYRVYGSSSSGQNYYIEFWNDSNIDYNEVYVYAYTTNAMPSSVQIVPNNTITWTVQESVDAVTWSSPVSMGTSTTPLYINLRSISYFGDIYRSSAFNACKNGGATTEGTAFNNTWSRFSGRNVTTYGGTALKFYSLSTLNVNTATDLAGLLTNHTGNCTAFSQLFANALQCHGLAFEPTDVTLASGTDQYFLMRKLSLNTPHLTNNPPYNYLMIFKYPQLTMAYGIAGDISQESGDPAQNIADPVEKVFDYHSIIKYDGYYYDPSYGYKYTNANTMAGHSHGVGNHLQLYPATNQTWLSIDVKSAWSGTLHFSN